MSATPRTVRQLIRTAMVGVIVLATTCLVATPAHAAGPGETFLASGVPLAPGFIAASGSGVESGNTPSSSAVSADGRYVAFLSKDDDLAPGAHPDAVNVFRKDRVTGAVVLISRRTGVGGEGLAVQSSAPRISADGNRVAWLSEGAFDPADVNDTSDVYLRDVGAATTSLASPVSSEGAYDYDLAADGQWIAFSSRAGLVPADTNSRDDVYRRNLGTGAVTLVSAINGGSAPGNAAASAPSISADGAWVAFQSYATDLVTGFVSGGAFAGNVFARRIATSATVLVSANHASATTGGNGNSFAPRIAGAPTTSNTLRVAYTSLATDLADNAVTDTSAVASGYLRALSVTASALITRASGSGGANAGSTSAITGISADASKVVFQSLAPDLAPGLPASPLATYVRNTASATTTRLAAVGENANAPTISADGAYAVWSEPGATADADPDLMAVVGRTLPAGPIELISRPAAPGSLRAAVPEVRFGRPGRRVLSADGRFVVVAASGAGLGVDGRSMIYRHDLRTGEYELVSRASGATGDPSSSSAEAATIDASGNVVAFVTAARLQADDTNGLPDVYLRDIARGTTTLISQNPENGAVGDAQAIDPALSADGRHVAFQSASTNLGAPGGGDHVYVRDLMAGTLTVADRAPGAGGAIGNGAARGASLSADGRFVAFQSRATNLSTDDADTSADAYVRDRASANTTLVSRRGGLAGAKLAEIDGAVALSGDGAVAVFTTSDETAAPEGGPWGGNQQVVARRLADGQNTLVSRAANGAVADEFSRDPAVNADGTVVAFVSNAANLLPGRGVVSGSVAAVYARTMTTGALSGPPAFGPFGFTDLASLSEDGQCMAFRGFGHTPFGGGAGVGDIRSLYVHVISGSCPKAVPAPPPAPGSPPASALPAAALSGVSLSSRRFKVGKGTTALNATGARAAKPKPAPTGTTIRFTLNIAATVRVTILRRVAGRKVGKRCVKPTPTLARRKRCTRDQQVGELVRTGVGAGARSIAFSGRLGKVRLAPGAYRAVIVATAPGGASAPVTLPFTVVSR